MEDIAKQFISFYYTTFDADRKSLAPLYRDTSMLTWESKQFQGTKSIIEHTTSLPFSKTTHQIVTMDPQPSPPGTALIILVTGNLLIDDSTMPLQFSQAFQLVQDKDTGSFYILNNVLRLVFSG